MKHVSAAVAVLASAIALAVLPAAAAHADTPAPPATGTQQPVVPPTAPGDDISTEDTAWGH
ncbi:hypothetical protein ABT095_22655 [Kitasatospora sp. NPDC002227]|uniref:hypothetical protein n=1 Tax=Kitasatospora sp. NPDC002227 TaxID=3154773 RepID=UPI003322B7D5